MPSAPPPIANGRFDAATATAVGLSAASLAFGIVMGVKAEKDKPTSNYVTGRDGSYIDLQNLVDDAHREAILADVGFATSLVSAVVAAYLYLGRSRSVSSAPPGSATTVSAGAVSGGGTLFVKGCF